MNKFLISIRVVMILALIGFTAAMVITSHPWWAALGFVMAIVASIAPVKGLTGKHVNSKIDFHWVEDGVNNGHPIWRLNVGDGDYIAKVSNGYTMGWNAILNNAGLKRPNADNEVVVDSMYSFISALEAKEMVERTIEEKIAKRVQEAIDSVTRYTDFMVAQGKLVDAD